MMRICVLALVALFVTGCGSLISPRQELQIGDGVHKELKKQYRLVDPSDPLAVWAVDLVKPMEQASRPFRNPDEIGGYKVAVIADDKLINAFAAPGGYTYIATGLILQSSSCAEIAGVMGHELAHVTQKHGVKALETAMAAQTLADMLLGEGTISSQAAQTIIGVLQSTKFSRENESESDEVGLQISAESGYNPHGLAEFFKKLLGKDGGVPEFLSSHPATDNRIKEVRAQISKRYGNKYDAKKVHDGQCQGTKMQLDAVKARIKGKKYKVAQ
jgi:predicted Zn-dependent protease